MGVIGAVRNIRGEMGHQPGPGKVPVVLSTQDPAAREVLEAHQAGRIASLAKTEELHRLGGRAGAAPGQGGRRRPWPGVTLYVPLEGLVDFGAEEEPVWTKEHGQTGQGDSLPSQKQAGQPGLPGQGPGRGGGEGAGARWPRPRT